MFKRLSDRIELFISQLPRPQRHAIICGEILLWAGYWASAIYKMCATLTEDNGKLMDRTFDLTVAFIIGIAASGALILSTIKKLKSVKGKS
jgi:hypothetical protein